MQNKHIWTRYKHLATWRPPTESPIRASYTTGILAGSTANTDYSRLDKQMLHNKLGSASMGCSWASILGSASELILDYLKGLLFFICSFNFFAASLNIQSNSTLKISKNLIPFQFLLIEALNQVIMCELLLWIGVILKGVV